MMIVARAVALSCILVSPGVSAHAQQSGDPSADFPDIVGLWEGEYAVAFARSHPEYPDDLAIVEMQLDVYRQEDNLIWAFNRWRPVGTAAWHVEETTGSFRLDDPSALIIAESGPVPVDWGTSGFLTGRAVDDALYLTYAGMASGTTFSVELERR